jgi:glycerol 2-dehydrogenase (NADP+)
MHWPVPLPPTSGTEDPTSGLVDLIPLLPNGDRHVLDEKEWSYIDTWKSLEKLVATGKVKAIGVSNMSIPFLERLKAECKIIPAVNQVRHCRTG